MADMLTPLQWRSDERPDGSAPSAFCWPTPPFAVYPQALPQTAPLDCTITGLNDKLMPGQLLLLKPDLGIALVQLPPSRRGVQLRFDQFRSLELTAPIQALPIDGDDTTPPAPSAAPTPFCLSWTTGGEWHGLTQGHVATPFGLFLFPPVADSAKGAVTRVFVPATTYSAFDIGSRIGDVLIEQHAATPRQVEQAAAQQAQMRQQKLGDILVTRNIVTPEQLLAALDHQSRMPLVRIGEALLSLGLITDAELQEALQHQQHDRSVPLGEILVRNGVITRPELQVAMARKMGYPLVDVDTFPVDAQALRKLPFAIASRLRVLPLLVRDGRLVIALEDPERRRAVTEEVEFSAQMKVLPVLAQSRSMELRMHAVYEQIGAVDVTRARSDEPDSVLPPELIGTEQLVETLERENDASTPDDRPIEQSDNSLVRLINTMIIEAHKDGVSDIHIESYHRITARR